MAKTPAEALHEALLPLIAGKNGVDSLKAVESVATTYPKQWEHDPVRALQRYSSDEGLIGHVGNIAAYVDIVLASPRDRYGYICHWIQCEEPRLKGCHCCAQHELVIRANTK